MPSTLRVSLSVFLSYLLVALTCVPVSTRARTRLKPKTRTAIQQSLARHRESELLVRFRGGISERDKETVIATHGALKKKDLQGVSGVEKLEILGGRDVRRVALEMLLNPQVEFAEPNYLIAKDDVVPNDPHFQQQWALRNTGQNGGQVGSDVNANGAWTITTGSKSTVIAVFAQTGKDLYDYYKAKPQDRDQNRAEIAGNVAGIRVGSHMWNFLSGSTPRDPQRLKNSLMKELCK